MHFASAKSFDFSKRRIIICFTVFTFAILADQLSKAWARENLADGPKYLFNSKIGFSLTSNSGSAFSLFQDSTILLTLAAVTIVGALLVAAFRTETSFLSIAYMVIAAGATGNILDRFFQPPYDGHGHVTDFIKFYSFPIFNIADSLVTLGAISLVLIMFRTSKETK